MWNTRGIIRDCTVFLHEGNISIAFPSKKYTNKEGEEKYQGIFGVESDEVYRKFMEAAKEAFNKFVQESAPPQQEAPVMNDGVPF